MRTLATLAALTFVACASDAADEKPPPIIDAWLTSWSEAQAARLRETCEREYGCDPAQYSPEVRPETSFGWDGADRVERIEDWEEGARYRVRVNGREILMRMREGEVVAVYLLRIGGRETLCREEECQPIPGDG